MKWCRFDRDGRPSYGIIEGDRITAVDGVPWGEHKKSSASVALATTKLLLPVVPGRKPHRRVPAPSPPQST